MYYATLNKLLLRKLCVQRDWSVRIVKRRKNIKSKYKFDRLAGQVGSKPDYAIDWPGFDSRR